MPNQVHTQILHHPTPRKYSRAHGTGRHVLLVLAVVVVVYTDWHKVGQRTVAESVLAVDLWVWEQVTVDLLVLAAPASDEPVALRIVALVLASLLDQDKLYVVVAVTLHPFCDQERLPQGRVVPEGNEALLPHAVSGHAYAALLLKKGVHLLPFRHGLLRVPRMDRHDDLRHRVVAHVDQLDDRRVLALHARETKLGRRAAFKPRTVLRARRRREHCLHRQQRGGGLVGGSLHQAVRQVEK
eukprot:7381823-Prymnesium_polylepis.1